MRRRFAAAALLAVALGSMHCEGDSVAPATVASVRVSPAGAMIAIGQTATFTAEALDAGGAVLAGRSFSFTSSNVGIATVENTLANPAMLTALALGSTTITATCEGKLGHATLTVQTVLDLQLLGRLVDGETNQPIGGAIVDYVTQSGSRQTTTGADGTFTFALSPSTEVLTVTARASGYVAGTLRVGAADFRDNNVQLETIALVRDTGMTGGISGVVRNARTNAVISSATVHVHQGQGRGSIREMPFATTSSAVSGNYSVQGLPAGSYTLTVRGDGFRTGWRTGIAVGNGGVTPNQDVALSPDANEIRIILTWGSSPNDLDAHLTGPNPSDAGRFHVYYGNPLNAAETPWAGLDLDDTNGAGPETITISRFNSGNYRFSVHDFSNRRSAASTALGSSGAKVELQLPNNAAYFYHVPNQSGTLWTVFELSGNIEDPTITVRNSISHEENPAEIPKPDSAADGDACLIGAATRTPKP